jgi:hypothetical protein
MPLVFVLLVSVGCPAAAVPPESLPGGRLRARVEAHLEARKEVLKESLAHYGLIFEVEQQDLEIFMKQVSFHWDGTGFALGTEYGPEVHGGGLLAFLLDHWTPDSRPARLEDEFRFRTNPRGVRLEEIYRGHRRQIFLPVPGRRAAEIRGELPAAPQLPRMRSGFRSGSEPEESDAYEFLGLLVAHEPDPSATWKNHLGQELSVELLLGNTRDYYLTNRTTAGELADHSHLHLVEVLLAWERRRSGARDADAIKRRFLEVEIAREKLEGDEGDEALGHYVESLGLLVADAGVSWRPDEKQRVTEWLRRLERDRFDDLEPVRLQHLTHLLKGLRLIAEHRTRLEGG